MKTGLSCFQGWAVGALAATALAAPMAASAGPLPAGWSCTGTCGSAGADGDVTASPQGGTYNYVVTTNGQNGLGLGFADDTSGSRALSSAFVANAGAQLSFYFNYVTTDGAGFSDYAYVQLLDSASSVVATLFTARTTTTGDTVPGFGLPGLAPGVTLAPPSTPIIPGGPSWSVTGEADGTCFDVGCGYTGWIAMDYTIASAGTYSLAFTALNFVDDAFQSGLAFDGVTIDGVPVDPGDPGIPLPSTVMLVGMGLAVLGLGRRRKA